MRQLVFAPEALADIEEIWDYIADDNVEAADRVVDKLLDASEGLRSSPEMGRQRDELVPGLRNWPVRSYLIFYRTRGETVEIVRVIHGARDIERQFEEPER